MLNRDEQHIAIDLMHRQTLARDGSTEVKLNFFRKPPARYSGNPRAKISKTKEIYD